jgi:acyl CoA:acetate/3-ketoacid CoA transferase beta subunit
MMNSEKTHMTPREIIARQCAREVRNGEVVNLGFGIPTLTANYLPDGIAVIFHSENGCFGFGPKPKTLAADSDLTNAGCEPVTLNPGAVIMDLATSLGAMRNAVHLQATENRGCDIAIGDFTDIVRRLTWERCAKSVASTFAPMQL